MRLLALRLLGFGLVLLFAGQAHARSFRVGQVPNGSVNGCATCHIGGSGGGPRNSFGVLIETSFLTVPGPGGNVVWGAELAQLDADNDGRSNGQELQDPSGVWSSGQPAPGTPALVTLPGIAATPVPALSTLGIGVLCLALFLGSLLATRRAQRTRS